MTNYQLTGVILAGGKSSRMGKDKANLRFQGETMLERTKRVIQASGINNIIISRNEPGYVNDKYQDLGPMGGIISVLEFAKSELNDCSLKPALLIMPIDMPYINSGVIATLIKSGSNLDCAMHYKNHPLPLFLPVTEEILASAKFVINSNLNLSIKRFISLVPNASLTCNQEQLFINTNTPSQWSSFTKQLAC